MNISLLVEFFLALTALLLFIITYYKLIHKRNKKPPAFSAADFRLVVDRAVERSRRDEANRAEERIIRDEASIPTNSNHHIVGMSGQSEQQQQSEIPDPPPPYFKDGDLPQYARNV